MTLLLEAPRPWVKICGVARPEDAELAVALGATAIGVNFWSGSPRCVEPQRAREIVAAVAGRAAVAGVFVNEDPERIEEIEAATGIDLIQLHGDEPPELLARFAPHAIRALRARIAAPTAVNGTGDPDPRSPSATATPSMEVFSPDGTTESSPYVTPLAFLVDGPAGARFGGTGEGWAWSAARLFVERASAPVLIAGGIRPENARRALEESGAAGVDVASGVESSPGVKDPEKMRRLMEELRREVP